MENKRNLIMMNKNVDNDCLLYRPYQAENERATRVKRECYSTSLDPRGYIPVYEYVVNNAPIMWDRETGYVHFTGIWKAMGNSKSDIVKLVDSNPELGTKKIRGGFLRIQGTWIPYDYAKLLCKRTAWYIRKELIPIFGQQFPLEVLDPEHEDYGCLLLDPKSRSFSKKPNHNQRRNFTMRPKKPYTKQQTKKINCRTPKPMKSSNAPPKKTQVMSVTRLLNEEDDFMDFIDSDSDDLSSLSSFGSSSPTPSPTFRVIQTYPPEDWFDQCPLLPPIYNPSQQNQQKLPSITNTTSPAMTSSSSTLSPSPPLLWSSPRMSPVSPTHVSQDIIDTISATILLQRLSQDDGARPFKPLESTGIPSKVIVGHQEFTICWE